MNNLFLGVGMSCSLMSNVSVEGTNKKLVMTTKIVDNLKTLTFFQVYNKENVVYSTNDLKKAIKRYEEEKV